MFTVPPSRLGRDYFAGLSIVLGLASASLASAAAYQLDDGVTVGSVQLGGSFNGVLVNQFTAQPGSLTITGIEFVWVAVGGSMNNAAFNLLVYSDPTNDGIFNDAILIHSEAAQAPAEVTTAPVAYHFTSGITFNPGDVFFVGYEEFADSPISIGLDAAGGTQSWVAWTGTNPATAGTIGTLSTFGPNFTKDFMIRAITTAPIPEPATASALAGSLALAGVLLRRRRR